MAALISDVEALEAAIIGSEKLSLEIIVKICKEKRTKGEGRRGPPPKISDTKQNKTDVKSPDNHFTILHSISLHYTPLESVIRNRSDIHSSDQMNSNPNRMREL